MFQSTRPARGATFRRTHRCHLRFVSIHAPRAGRDISTDRRGGKPHSFQSTRPARGATKSSGSGLCHLRVSIHAPRAGRDSYAPRSAAVRFCFNPRAPRGARLATPIAWMSSVYVSIHAPRAGRDPAKFTRLAYHPQFQSTRPARGATGGAAAGGVPCSGFNPRAPRGARLNSVAMWSHSFCFNPRAPRGARPSAAPSYASLKKVSIHAPRAGRDRQRQGLRWRPWSFNPRAPRGARPPTTSATSATGPFQSTRPARGATCIGIVARNLVSVSIHAPRAGRDFPSSVRAGAGRGFNPRAPRGARPPAPDFLEIRRCFNPRAPRGARPVAHLTALVDYEFQSTRPARGATTEIRAALQTAEVSIHAPRAGRDPPAAARPPGFESFNPRAPRGARPTATRPNASCRRFQSTRPARGATPGLHQPGQRRIGFNPRAPRGARLAILAIRSFFA